MIVHPEVQERNAKISQALAMAVPGTRKTDSGFRAFATVMTTELTDPLKENLSQILVGEWNEQRSLFLAIVCDNNELPVEFETEAEALGQAIELNDSLVRRYGYGLFATYGILASVNPEQNTQGATLHFFKNGRPQ
jgi:hypothetical protein